MREWQRNRWQNLGTNHQLLFPTTSIWHNKVKNCEAQMQLDPLSSQDISDANTSNSPALHQGTPNVIGVITFGSNIHVDYPASLAYTLHSTITRRFSTRLSVKMRGAAQDNGIMLERASGTSKPLIRSSSSTL